MARNARKVMAKSHTGTESTTAQKSGRVLSDEEVLARSVLDAAQARGKTEVNFRQTTMGELVPVPAVWERVLGSIRQGFLPAF
jgi:hypothetical protein